MDQLVYSSGLTPETATNVSSLSPQNVKANNLNTGIEINSPETASAAELNNSAKITSGKDKSNRWSFTVYATPSISYRYLGEAKTNDLHFQNGPIAPNVTHGVNNFVNQTTLPGYELGGGIIYNLSKSVRIKPVCSSI